MNERISSITGKPVRKYTRKAAIEVVAAPLQRKPMKIENYNGINAKLITTEDYVQAYITPCATMNCQLTVIGCAGSFIRNSRNIIADLKEIKSKFHSCNILLCDIKESYMKFFNEKIPAKNIIMVSPYKSTNGSNMNICLINMTNL